MHYDSREFHFLQGVLKGDKLEEPYYLNNRKVLRPTIWPD